MQKNQHKRNTKTKGTARPNMASTTFEVSSGSKFVPVVTRSVYFTTVFWVGAFTEIVFELSSTIAFWAFSDKG